MTDLPGTAVTVRTSPVLGALSLGMGLLACLGVAAIWLVSTAAWFDMPGWLRVVSGWAFPVGAIGAIGLGLTARAQRSGVRLATVGFVLAGLSAIGFVVMIATNSY